MELIPRTQIDPSTLDPEMQAKLGVSQVGSLRTTRCAAWAEPMPPRSVDDVKKMRKQYKHGGESQCPSVERPKVCTGQVVYEWEQNLTEIHIWVMPPPGVRYVSFIAVT